MLQYQKCIILILLNSQRIKSGPGNNRKWSLPHQLLQEHKIKEAIKKMAELRTQWLNHVDFTIRAARHYIGLCQVYYF